MPQQPIGSELQAGTEQPNPLVDGDDDDDDDES